MVDWRANPRAHPTLGATNDALASLRVVPMAAQSVDFDGCSDAKLGSTKSVSCSAGETEDLGESDGAGMMPLPASSLKPPLPGSKSYLNGRVYHHHHSALPLPFLPSSFSFFLSWSLVGWSSLQQRSQHLRPGVLRCLVTR